MRIAVCLKRVPDTTTKIVIGPGGAAIDETGVKFIPNPYDEYAVEEALRLREAAGSGETLVCALGPEQAQETLRTALAMGIDRGLLLQSPGGADGLEVARALAAALGGESLDLVLLGKVAVDDGGHQVGPMLAELLGWPCITAITKLSIADGVVEAEREVEGGVESVRAALPAVLTCEKGLNTPRLPSLKGIMAAKKKPLEVRAAAVGAGSLSVLGLTLPPERQPGRIVGEGPDAVPELVRLLREEAKVL